MTTAKDVVKLIKDNDVKYADFRFTDPRGSGSTSPSTSASSKTPSPKGRCSTAPRSPAGRPSTSPTCADARPGLGRIDPFFAETTLSLVCDVLEPTTGEPYNRDPRGIARRPKACQGVRRR